MVKKIAENFNRLSRLHQRHRRQTTDGTAIAYSERERKFTSANKNSSKDEIVNVNIFTTSHTYFNIPKKRTYFVQQIKR